MTRCFLCGPCRGRITRPYGQADTEGRDQGGVDLNVARSVRVKYGHESRGTRSQESLCSREPGGIYQFVSQADTDNIRGLILAAVKRTTVQVTRQPL
jgi:hypothetical protein